MAESGELSSYLSCPSCGFIQVERGRAPDERSERARYLLHDNDPSDPGYRSWLLAFVRCFIVPYARPGASVLDFGSGPVPALCGLLRGLGFDASAWDPYFAPDTAWRDRSWDAIVLHEVAEHLLEPGATFRDLASLLAPDGLLCLRTRFAPGSSDAFRDWWYRRDITHVGFFRRESLRRHMSTLGLEEIAADDVDSAVFRMRR